MGEKRASKKQRELLTFIENFINSTGYGPSYREIMRALDYKSVSTVAVHVDGLIAAGLLRKTDNSARSLEIVDKKIEQNPDKPHIDWLKKHIKTREVVETEASVKEVQILKQALEIVLDQTSE